MSRLITVWCGNWDRSFNPELYPVCSSLYLAHSMTPLLFFTFMFSIFPISVLPRSLNNNSYHPEKQQHFLQQFKAGIVNSNTSLPDWTPIHPLCNWTVITCDPSSRSIIALNLSYINIHGTISTALGNPSSLRSLDLSNNALTGVIPHQLDQLPRMQTLWLHRNQLQGTIPRTLSACRSLYEMALSFNQLRNSTPPELSPLTSLKNLYLGGNNLTSTIPPSFKNLSALVVLYLEENDLTGTIPHELGACWKG